MLDCYKRKIDYLRISVTDLCNLRCKYCMPAEGVKLISHEDILSFEEIYEITSKAVEMGINKVRLTGGEPLVRRNILTLVKMIAGIDGIKDFALTTNGTLLNKLAKPLKEAGIHRLNISLDTMNPDRFTEITRGGNLNLVFEGIEAAVNAGFDHIKLNCVIRESSSEKDAHEVGLYAEENNFQVRFIRWMNLENGNFWVVEGGDGGNCEICNRIRLSSDGKIYPCLFSDLNFSVRELGIEKAVKMTLENKPESGKKSNNNKFYALGG